jgi:hypothetical protein
MERKMVRSPGGGFFVETTVPEQREQANGVLFPRLLQPGGGGGGGAAASDLNSLVGAIKKHKSWLEQQLKLSGAVLLRGFGVHTAEDFNAVVEAFDYPELPYIGGAAPRYKVVGRIYTTNDSPPDQTVTFHHEMAQVPEYPGKLFFFCETEAAEGGETPITLSHVVYERMLKEWPEFVAQLQDKGLLYTRNLADGDDLTSAIGRGWQSTFLTEDRVEAEKRAAKLGAQLEWLADGGVKMITGPMPAIKEDELRQRPVWFNSMVSAYTAWKDSRNDPEKACSFGDGTPLPRNAVLACLQILHQEKAAVPWRHGDILLVDNTAVQHSRNTFVPPRRVLASLVK